MTGAPVDAAIDAAEAAVRGGPPPREVQDAAELARLAALDPLEYERERRAAAKRLGFRSLALDRLVERARPGAGADKPGRPLVLPEPEPWPEPVDGAELLDEIASAARQHVVFAPEAADAVSLWCAFTWLIDRFDISPKLALTSPEPGCGKSTLRTVIARLVRRPLSTSNISPAALFRAIEASAPTLLVDEADTTLTADATELRGVVNSSHEREGAYVIRVVERNGEHEPRKFSTWCAMLLAGIGGLPATVASRSITVTLQRKGAGETVARLDRAAKSRLDTLARKLARWAADHAGEVSEPDDIPGLSNRAADNWRPLYAIAAAAGGTWPARAETAARCLSGDAEESSTRTLLLADLREIFGGRAFVHTGEILSALHAREARPWAEWRNGRPLSAHALARLLKGFKIEPRRDPAGDRSGYRRADFLDAWGRYLPKQSSGAPEPFNLNGLDENQSSGAFPGPGALKAPQPIEKQAFRSSGALKWGGGGSGDRGAGNGEAEPPPGGTSGLL